MSKRINCLDARQLSFDFDRSINEYRDLKTEIITYEHSRETHSHQEACIEIAAALKKMQRKSGLSREQMVDGINDYFGWDASSTKRLTIHMFNHYLSKPVQYPIPSYYIFAVQRVTESLDMCKVFADAERAKVINGEEVRQMALGKIDENILELQRLKRELRGNY
jgi:hypothetical protein